MESIKRSDSVKTLCFIQPDISKGTGGLKVLNLLTKELLNEYNIHVVSLGFAGNKPAYNFDKSIKIHKLFEKDTRIREALMKHGISKLKKIYKENNIDIAVSIGASMNALLILAAHGTNVKTVFCEHLNCLNPIACDKTQKIMQRIGAKHANKIITLTKRDMEAYIDKYNIKKEKIETVFLINTYSASFVSLLKKFLNVKFVFCDHGAVSNELDKKFNMKHRNLASKKCDITVTLTQRNIDDYKTIFKTPASKLVCIPNWISDDVIDVASSKYNIKSKKIITVGRFSKEKGYDMLIDIANEVLKKHPDWTWDIFGDGETFDQVEKSINKYNINDKVFLKGQSNDIYHKYRDYAIYVMNCYDKKEMSNKICDLIENDDLRQNFSDNSFNNIEKFNKNHILKKWVEIIENL